MREVFPSGMDPSWTSAMPLVLHNRWVSPSSPYYTSGNFTFAPYHEGDEAVLPIDRTFFRHLFAPAKDWGMVTYEQVRRVSWCSWSHILTRNMQHACC